MRAACLAVALLAAAASPGAAQPSQIVISQPAEATTMDPGRSTQVLTVDYFVNLYDTLTRWDTGLQLQPGQRFYELMEQARYTLDQAKRKQLHAEATRIIHEEKPSCSRR